MPSPPLSPPLGATRSSANKHLAVDNSIHGRARRGGPAHTITEECERLFCETLRAVFLGEGNLACQDSLVTGVQNNHQSLADINDYGDEVRRHPDRLMDSPEPEVGSFFNHIGPIVDWVEMWDYVGGNRFRGFVAEKDEEKVMFAFFDRSAAGGDLKSGLMALLELCEVSYFSCSRLAVCIHREMDPRAMDVLAKDLGWIGFQLTTLNDFTHGDTITSDQWLFMDMEV